MAQAQQPADAPRPPQLQPLEEGEPPEVTIRPPEQQRRITETRAPGGKVTEVKVSTGGSTYVLKANDQAGSALPGDGQANAMRAAQWEVLEFDLRRTPEQKQGEGEAEAGAVGAEAPPAPPENKATNKPANKPANK